MPAGRAVDGSCCQLKCSLLFINRSLRSSLTVPRHELIMTNIHTLHAQSSSRPSQHSTAAFNLLLLLLQSTSNHAHPPSSIPAPPRHDLMHITQRRACFRVYIRDPLLHRLRSCLVIRLSTLRLSTLMLLYFSTLKKIISWSASKVLYYVQ
jgi:hypothetical protein